MQLGCVSTNGIAEDSVRFGESGLGESGPVASGPARAPGAPRASIAAGLPWLAGLPGLAWLSRLAWFSCFTCFSRFAWFTCFAWFPGCLGLAGLAGLAGFARPAGLAGPARPAGLARFARLAGLTGLARLARLTRLARLPREVGLPGLALRVLLLVRRLAGFALARCAHRDGSQDGGDRCGGSPHPQPLPESPRGAVPGRDVRWGACAPGRRWHALTRFLEVKREERIAPLRCRRGRFFLGLHGELPSPRRSSGVAPLWAHAAWIRHCSSFMRAPHGDVAAATCGRISHFSPKG